MMKDLSEFALEAIVISMLLMLVKAVSSLAGALLGIGLAAAGVYVIVLAYRHKHLPHGVFGVIVLAFGVAIEFASLESLFYLALLGAGISFTIRLLSGRNEK